MLPLTHHHPRTPVDGANFRDLAIGYTGENPWIDYLEGKDEVGIRSTVLLYDDEALDAYERGEIQLSPGYVANFEWQQGTDPHGNPYDIIMKEITDVNHLALLPAGRGGEDAVVMDQAPVRKTIFDIVKDVSEDGAPYGNDNASKEHVSKDDEAEKVLNQLHSEMAEFPEVEFTRENYDKYLGGEIETPLGKAKMGDNQYEKLKANGRTSLIGAVFETLTNPGYMGRDTDGKIIYIKTFEKKAPPGTTYPSSLRETE